MTAFWALLVIGCIWSLVESDAAKLRKWHDRDLAACYADRIASVGLLVLALWRAAILWGLA